MANYEIAEFVLMLSGAFFGVAVFLCIVAAAVYYFIEGNE